MRKFAVMCLAVASVAGSAAAATMCNDANPRNTTSLNADGGCVAGGLLFNDFQYLGASGNVSPQIDLVSASVDNSGTVLLTFNPNMSAPTNYEDVYFMFSVTGAVNQVDLSIGGRNATINETVCSSAMNINAPSCAAQNTLANIVAYSAPPGPNQSASGVFAPANQLWIFKDIGVNPSSPNSGGGALTTFTQSFHIAFPNDVPGGEVPEPLTMGLTGIGLGAMSLVRRFRRNA